MASLIKENELTLRTVCSVLGRVCHKWMKIGVQLGIPHHVLKQFEKEEDPLTSVINYWLQGNNLAVPTSWKSVVAVLKDTTVEEAGLAEEVRTKYCQNDENEDNKGAKVKSTETSSEDSLDPVVKKDLKYILQQNLQEIIAQYGSYVDCLRGIIEESGVLPIALRTYLLTLSAFSCAGEDETLTLLSHKKSELQKGETISEIFSFLVTECASFLNYDIFERIIKNYLIREKNSNERLQYPKLLKEYINKHKISEFVQINPLLKTRSGFKELILKYDIESTCRLAKVIDLQMILAKFFGVLPSALEIVDIKEGCVVVTFLISASIADALFTPDTEFTSQQEDELRAAAILRLKCNGHTFHFSRKDKEKDKLKILFNRIRGQLLCSVCFGTYTQPKLLQCHHANCHKCLVRLVELDKQGELIIPCPNCWQLTQVPLSGVAGLQSDFRMNQLLEVIGADNHKKDKGERKDKGQHEVPLIYIEDCDETIVKLKKQEEDNVEQLKQQEIKIVQKEEEIDVLKTDYAKGDERFEVLMTHKAEMERKIESLQIQCAQAEKQNEFFEQYKSRIEEFKKILREVESSKEKIFVELTEAKTQLAEAELEKLREIRKLKEKYYELEKIKLELQLNLQRQTRSERMMEASALGSQRSRSWH